MAEMGMAVLLALAAAFCWGVAPVFAKLGLSRLDPVTGLAVRSLLAGGVVLGWLLASGRLAQLRDVPPQSWTLIGAEAVLATLLGDLAYYAALKLQSAGDVSLVLSAAPLFTLWTAALLLGDEVTVPQLIGAVLIAAGVWLVGAQPRP